MKKQLHRLTLALTTTAALPLLAPPARSQAQLPYAVAACTSNPYCSVAAIGVGVWLLTNRNNQVVCTWQGCVRADQYRQQPYNTPLRIDDPDQPVEATMVDYVWGSDQTEAARNCQNLLSQYGMKFQRIVRNSRSSRKWQCWGWSNHPETTHIPDRRRR